MSIAKTWARSQDQLRRGIRTGSTEGDSPGSVGRRALPSMSKSPSWCGEASATGATGGGHNLRAEAMAVGEHAPLAPERSERAV